MIAPFFKRLAAQERLQQEQGFTLVELLIVTGTLSILLVLSIQSYNIYKARVYDAYTEQSAHNINSAIQAGLIDNDFMEGAGFAWVNLTSAGQPSTAIGRRLLPGYIHPENMNMWVSYDAWCATGILGDGCMEIMLSGRHCRGNKWFMEQHIRNGPVLKIEWEAPGGC